MIRLYRIIVIFTVLVVSDLCGSILVHEGFDYSATDLIDANGGIGWSNSWKGGYFGTSDCTMSLTNGIFAGFNASPFTQSGKYAYRDFQTTSYLVRELETPISTTNSHSIYLSFLYYRYSATGQPWSPIGVLSKDSGGNINGNCKGIKVGGSHANTQILVEVDGNRGFTSDILSTNKAQFIVAKVVFNEGASTNDNIYAMVYDEGDTIGNEPTTWECSKTGVTLPGDTLDFVYAKVETPCDVFVWDDFRIGETWADVVIPTPSGSMFIVK